MKFLFDFFPTLLFFIVYKFFGIFPATYAIIMASVVQISIYWVKYKTVEPMHIVLLIFMLIFGGLTLYFHEVSFLMWKVSIVNWLIGGGMILSHCFKKNFLQYFFDFVDASQKNAHSTFAAVPQKILNRLNFAWGLFFIFMGCLNWYIAFHFSLNIWVNFKVFGMIGLTIVFTIFQSLYLYRYLTPKH